SLCLATGLLILAACGGNDSTPPAPQGTLVLGPQETCNRDLATAPPDVTVFGAGPGDYLADRFSLASGDFNADGFADALVGAPLADGPDNGRENSGEAYVIFGSAQPNPTADLAQGAGVTITGENPGDNLGFTVAAGDVNGDGLDDAIIGARFASTAAAPAAGKAYVVFGREGLSGTFDTANGDPDATISGRSGDYLTITLAAGDVDGDGIDDVLMGAGGMAGPAGDRPTAGGAVVVLGSAEIDDTDLAQTTPFLRVFGAAAGDNLPNHLATGDLDGDGRGELIIGGPLVDGDQREDAGAVYIVPVPEDGGEFDLAGGSGFQRVTGGARKDMLGFEVAAGDVNGDGVTDAIIGARDADGPGDAFNNAGEVHILFGGDQIPEGRDLLDRRSDVLITGGDPTDSLGFSVTTGDVNGDGVTDVLAGVPVADSCENARLDGGDAYAVFGRSDWPSVITLKSAGDLTFLGAEEGDELGFSAATGDFNGDGIADVMLGALQADGPDNSRPDGGELYIILMEKQ
ncbi:MAG TPA: integrin alpha, partial [Dehalococcoidia bacterium]|nr:integrin alpha [Dehalococcoidia bacterium]